GSGMARLGNTNGVVTSWSDLQVVATVALGAGSGTAQILQNGVWSNSVSFTIDLPHVANVSPTAGSADTVVTISGNGFGDTQGSGAVWIGSGNGIVTSWSDTQVVASVASNAVSGVVKIQQNGIWSNRVTFTVPQSTATALTLVPSVLNMSVCSTHSIQALDASGQPVTGLTWTSSDTTVATLSTDDPPTITMVATGTVTITAGNASSDITVYDTDASIQLGTALCSNPGNGSGFTSIVPAVPSATGVADVFALQADGNVSAITSDCATAWTVAVGTDKTLIPDFQGGLVVADAQSIQRLDGMTGEALPSYTSSSGNLSTPVIHTDGTIFVLEDDAVVGINPQTGNRKFRIRMDNSMIDQQAYPPSVGNLMIAGDGYAYVPYSYITYDDNFYGGGFTTSESEHLRLLRVGTSGDSYAMSLGDWDYSEAEVDVVGYIYPDTPYGPEGPYGTVSQSTPVPSIGWTTPITNADAGVLLSWEARTDAYCGFGFNGYSPAPSTGCVEENIKFCLTTTSGARVASQTTSSIPGQASPIQPILQRADGSYIGIVNIGPEYGQQTQNMVAFTPSGNPLWTVPNDTPQIATADGGVIGASRIMYDQTGKATGQSPDAGTTDSWRNNLYADSTGGDISDLKLPQIDLASSWAALPGGNASANGTATVEPYLAPLPCFNDLTLCIGESSGVAMNSSRDTSNAAAQDIKDRPSTAEEPSPLPCNSGQSPCSFEAMNDAMSSLRTLVSKHDCGGGCNQFVYSKARLNLTQEKFRTYLARPYRFYDATRSTAPMRDVMCDTDWLSIAITQCAYDKTPVKDWWATTGDKPSAFTRTPSGKDQGLLIFFDPAQMCNSWASTTGGKWNQAVIFHEALHGETGLYDGSSIAGIVTLESVFGIPFSPSISITNYLVKNIQGLAGASAT